MERECDPAELVSRPGGRVFHTNVPRATTQYVGGDVILEEIADQLRLGSVVTLTGTGGVGKTRAATEFCRRQFAEFPDGVYFVDLAPIADADAVVGALASVLPFVALGERSVLRRDQDGLKAGQVLSSSAVLKVAVVNGSGRLP